MLMLIDLAKNACSTKESQVTSDEQLGDFGALFCVSANLFGVSFWEGPDDLPGPVKTQSPIKPIP